MNTRQVAIKILPPPVKRSILRNRRRAMDGVIGYRRLSGRLGPLPTFLIIGFGRCGTTYLYDRLLEHPNIRPSLVKEINFFTNNYSRGIDWYRAHFTSALDWQGDGPVAVGDASVGYVVGSRVPYRVTEHLPEAKIIVLVRNPVDRAQSHFYHNRRLGLEPLPTFEAAIDAEAERMCALPSRSAGGSGINGFGRAHFSYMTQGFYANYLDRWLDVFPPERLMIIQSEEFYRDPSGTLRGVTDYLGLPDWRPQEYAGHKQFSYPKMNPETRKRLSELSHPHNERLFAMVGENYGWNDEFLAGNRWHRSDGAGGWNKGESHDDPSQH